MNLDESWLIGIILGIIFVAVIVEGIIYFREFRRNIRYLEKERRRAYSEEEYEYWTQKIKRQYLRLIPFMSVILDRRDQFEQSAKRAKRRKAQRNG